MTELLASPEDLREFLELPAGEGALTSSRATLLLGQVSGLVLSYCHRDRFTVDPAGSGDDGTISELVDGTGSRDLLVARTPLLEVVSVVEDPRGAATELLEGTGFEWSAHGILERIDGSLWRRRFRWYEVLYRAGFEAVPPAVELVVLRVAARAVTNPEGLATESGGGYVSGFAFDETRLPTLAPADRRDLDPYRL